MKIESAEIFEDMGIAVFHDGDECYVLPEHSPQQPVSVDPHHLLVSGEEGALGFVQRDTDVDSLGQLVCQLYRAHNAWHFLRVAVDPQASESRRARAIAGVERRLVDTHPARYVRLRLMWAPLPEDSDLKGTLAQARGRDCTAMAALLGQIGERWDIAARMRTVVRQRLAPLCATEPVENVLDTGRVLFDHCLDDGDPEYTAFRLVGEQGRHLPQSLKDVIYAAFDCLEPASATDDEFAMRDDGGAGLHRKPKKAKQRKGHQSKPTLDADEDIDEARPAATPALTWRELLRDWPVPARPADIKRIDRQIAATLDQLSRGRIDQFWTFLTDLIRDQRNTSREEHIAKSLCRVVSGALELSQVAVADTLSEAVVELLPVDAHVFSIRAEVLRRAGRLELAEEIYRRSIDPFPHDAFPLTGLAETLRQQGRLREAEELYRRSIDLFPQNAVPLTGLAETLRQQGRLREAEEIYRRTIDLFPQNAFPLTGLAETLRQQGRLREAEEIYRRSIDLFPQNAVPLNGLAETLRQQGRLREAEDIYRRSIDLFPHDAVPLNGLAETLRQQGRMNAAEETYRQAMERFPQNGYARAGLATVLMARRAFAEVHALLTKPAYVTEQDWVDYHILAMSYLRDGQVARARTMLAQGLEQCPLASRPFYQTALVVADLALGAHQAALDNVVIADFRGGAGRAVGGLLRLHALAGLNQTAEARAQRQALELTDDGQRRLLSKLDRRYGLAGDAPPVEEVDRRALDARIIDAEVDVLVDLLRAA